MVMAHRRAGHQARSHVERVDFGGAGGRGWSRSVLDSDVRQDSVEAMNDFSSNTIVNE
jgi:hypothetical protein